MTGAGAPATGATAVDWALCVLPAGGTGCPAGMVAGSAPHPVAHPKQISACAHGMAPRPSALHSGFLSRISNISHSNRKTRRCDVHIVLSAAELYMLMVGPEITPDLTDRRQLIRACSLPQEGTAQRASHLLGPHARAARAPQALEAMGTAN